MNAARQSLYVRAADIHRKFCDPALTHSSLPAAWDCKRKAVTGVGAASNADDHSLGLTRNLGRGYAKRGQDAFLVLLTSFCT